MSEIQIKTEKIKYNELDYFSFGGGKKVFIMLPGLSVKSVMLTAAGIASAYRSFGEEFTVYVFDRPKFLSENYTIEMLADDTAQAIKALGLKDCYVFGVSQGGMMAQCIAVKYPELVKKLFLGSTTSRVTEDSGEVLSQWLSLAEKGDTSALCDCMIDTLYSQSFGEKFGDFIRMAHSDISGAELERFCILAKSCEGFDVYNSLSEIKCPVMVVGAQYDKVLPAQASYDIADRLGCEIYMYGEGFGHCVFDEAADYKDKIFKFFNSDIKE